MNGKVRVEHTLACDPDMKLRKRRVLAATSSGRRMVYRLRTTLGRELLATAEHPLRTMDGWRPLGCLGPGRYIAARLAGSDVCWDRVTAVELAGERDTYDLRVEEDHNFIANDLVVHNSHAASCPISFSR